MSPLWKNIFRTGSSESSLASFLAGTPIFSELSARERAYLTEYLHIRHYEPGETVYAEGDIGSGLYMIRSGRIRLSMDPPDGDTVEIARLEAGDFFGETALTEASPRLTTAVANDACELVGLFRSDLSQLAQIRPPLCNKILLGLNKVLSRRIQAMSALHRDSLSTLRGEK